MFSIKKFVSSELNKPSTNLIKSSYSLFKSTGAYEAPIILGIPTLIILIFAFQPSITTDGANKSVNKVSLSSKSTNSEEIVFPNFKRVDMNTGLKINSSYTAQNFAGYAGVYVNDFNGDGYEDLMVTDGNNPVLFKNSNGKFQETGLLSDYSNVVGAHFFDHDNSGDSDLLLLRRNSDPVFLENIGGDFKRNKIGFKKRLTRPYSAISADYNKDGCIDILITQWGSNEPMSHNRAQEIHENHPKERPQLDTGFSDFLYTGNCNKFEEVTLEANLKNTSYLTFTGSFVDFNNDNYPDIHLANDFGRDVFYRNNQNGTFEPIDMGINSDRNAMSSNIADLNDDLEPDLFVTNVYYPENSVNKIYEKLIDAMIPIPEGNNAFINQKSGFKDKAKKLGIKKGGWGWGSAIGDFSNNRHLSIVHTSISSHPRFKPSNYWAQLMIFRGTGKEFERINSTDKGFEIDNGRGLAKLDYNNDGNLDIVMSIQTRAKESSKHFKLYKNTGSGDFLQVMLEGEGYVETGTELYLNTSSGTQYRILDSGSDMLSQDSPVIHFGLGNSSLKNLRVEYPSGSQQVLTELKKNHRYMLKREQKSAEVIF
jgi:hypothetical protein